MEFVLIGTAEVIALVLAFGIDKAIQRRKAKQKAKREKQRNTALQKRRQVKPWGIEYDYHYPKKEVDDELSC